jgi:hypothetical protein
MGNSVTFTATVTGTAPTGSVAFTDGGTMLGGCGAVGLPAGSAHAKTATCSSANLTAGGHNIVASYSGDSANARSTTSVLTQTVNKATSTAALSSSANPSVVGASVSFTATVTGSAPTGTVAFTDGGTTLSGCGTVALPAGSANAKTATCSSASLSASTHNIVATYGGDSANAGSTSSILTQTVNKATSTAVLSSSANPSVVGANISFTATVTGSAPTGTVAFTDGGTTLSGCGAVAVTGSGNIRTAACATSSLSAGTHSIVATYGGDANDLGSNSAPLSQAVNSGGGPSVNVALASAGAVASASSTFSSAYPASAINDGDRAGLHFGAGGVWKDATASTFPDWVEIDFSGAKTIDHVIVYSMQDNNLSPVDPSNTMTFTLNGLTAFNVQAWSGMGWVTLGSVTANNLVKRTVSFSATTTSKIRVVINGGRRKKAAPYSYITEVEAWTPGVTSEPTPGTTLASSLNPAKKNQSITFTATVTGTNPTGTVAFTSGGNPIAGCTAVALTGSGNSRTALCMTSFAAQGTYSIVAGYGGDGSNAPGASAPLSEVVVSRK